MKTKANSRRNSLKKRLTRVFFAIIFLVFLLWFLGSVVSGIAAAIVKPIYVAKTWIYESYDTIPEYFRSRTELLEDMSNLKRVLAEHEAEVVSLHRLATENETLRSLLSATGDSRIAAGVVARPPSVPYDQLFIDRGRGDSIQEGAYVFGAEEHVLGYVLKTFHSSSLVRLFSAPGVEVTAYILGPDVFTTAYGMGGGIIEVRVPQGITLTVGDIVILPTTEPALLGTIHTVDSVATEAEQRGYVSSPVPLQSLRLVSISERVVESIEFDEVLNSVEEWKSEHLRIDVPESYLPSKTPSSTRATSTTATTTASESVDEE